MSYDKLVFYTSLSYDSSNKTFLAHSLHSISSNNKNSITKCSKFGLIHLLIGSYQSSSLSMRRARSGACPIDFWIIASLQRLGSFDQRYIDIYSKYNSVCQECDRLSLNKKRIFLYFQHSKFGMIKQTTIKSSFFVSASLKNFIKWIFIKQATL